MKVWWLDVGFLLGALLLGLLGAVLLALGLGYQGRRDRAFLRQLILGQLLYAATRGLPLQEALRALGDDLSRRATKRKIPLRRRVVAWLILTDAKVSLRNERLHRLAEKAYDVAAAMEEGSLETGLAVVPEIIPAAMCTLLGEAEKQGTLLGALADLDALEASGRSFRGHVRGALSYPLLLLVVLSIVAGFWTFVIMPKFMEINTTVNKSHPSSFLDSVRGIQTLLTLGVPALLVSFFLGASALVPDSSSTRWIAAFARSVVPGVRHAYRAALLSRFARTLAALLRAGLPAPLALRTAAPMAVKDPTLVWTAARLADDGASVLGALVRAGALPATPTLPGDATRTLDALADRADDDHRRWVRRLSNLVLPVSLLALGALVASYYWPAMIVTQRMMRGLW